MPKDQHSFYYNKAFHTENSGMQHHRLTIYGKVSQRELMMELDERGFEGQLDDLVFSGSVEWDAVAAVEDIAARNERLDKAKKSTEEYELRTYLRLKEKYGD